MSYGKLQAHLRSMIFELNLQFHVCELTISNAVNKTKSLNEAINLFS